MGEAKESGIESLSLGIITNWKSWFCGYCKREDKLLYEYDDRNMCGSEWTDEERTTNQ